MEFTKVEPQAFRKREWGGIEEVGWAEEEKVHSNYRSYEEREKSTVTETTVRGSIII